MSFGNILSNFNCGDDDNFSIIIGLIVLFLLFGYGGFGGIGGGSPFGLGGFNNNLGCCETDPCCCRRKHHHHHRHDCNCCCEPIDPCINKGGYQNEWGIWLIIIIIFFLIGDSQDNCCNND